MCGLCVGMCVCVCVCLFVCSIGTELVMMDWDRCDTQWVAWSVIVKKLYAERLVEKGGWV